jgi:cytochrome c
VCSNPLSGFRPCGDAAIQKDRSAMLSSVSRQMLLLLMLTTPALAMSPAEQRGKTYALTNCARCHSIDRVTPSPLRVAPPFRTLHLRYPVEDLGEALAEGIVTGHPTMPEFQLDPDQIHDLLSYLKTLE